MDNKIEYKMHIYSITDDNFILYNFNIFIIGKLLNVFYLMTSLNNFGINIPNCYISLDEFTFNKSSILTFHFVKFIGMKAL